MTSPIIRSSVPFYRNAGLLKFAALLIVHVISALLAVLILGLALKGATAVLLESYAIQRVNDLTEQVLEKDQQVANAVAKAAYYQNANEQILAVNKELAVSVVSLNSKNIALQGELAIEQAKGPIDKLSENKRLVAAKEAVVKASNSAVKSTEEAYDKTVKLIKAW